MIMSDHFIVHLVPPITTFYVGVVMARVRTAAGMAYDTIERVGGSKLPFTHVRLQRKLFVVLDVMTNLPTKRREAFQMHGKNVRAIVERELLLGDHGLFAP